MPQLDLSNLNTVLCILGLYVLAYAFLSVKIKQFWYLGEALPAVIVGIALGQVGTRWIDPEDWGMQMANGSELQNNITLGMCRIVIGVQLVIAGFQLPAQYQRQRWRAMAICLLGLMTIMWLCTSACMLAAVPKLTFLAALVIGSCVTCTDPILSQAVAKGPFADNEAGANDGFGFPFLMLAVYLIRHASSPEYLDGEAHAERSVFTTSVLSVRQEHQDIHRHGIGRLKGGVGVAIRNWVVETWIYFILLAIVYGAVCGFMSMYATKLALRKKWIDGEMYLLWPTGLGLFLVGTCGLLGTDDLLACFVAGNCLNWDGHYLEETEVRHDEVNSCIDVLLNFGGFMYIGAILPWDEFSSAATGLTYGRLVGLGFLVLLFRRIPAVFALYKTMPEVCGDWKEALFMGYFGPIGIGAVFYVEHARHLFPEPGEAETEEENNLAAALAPVVYWLVFFSIVVHGLSIPALNLFLKWRGVTPLIDEKGGVEMDLLSRHSSIPKNARRSVSQGRRGSVIVHNRFSRVSMSNMAEQGDAGLSGISRRWPQGIAWDDDDALSRSQSLARDQSPKGRARGRSDAQSLRPSVRPREISFFDERSASVPEPSFGRGVQG
ncbi:uncharacterized protein LTR77_010956 [Saxophila tyrrhenica]|uniref:Cation/H+ exchanger transmembrane domain-containing protein n=1 Tax=Saxophila tyrrhenica TaxID=1690608 RepID=A0AAV9NWT7_9PEZI|nr:hypothetical protein LTR77_010956 [Saxophila tyrrhenica]